MATVTLEVDGKSYRWDLPQGTSKITAAGLKDLIGKRTAGEVLYHTKLRFLSEKGPVDDGDEVPLTPAAVKVRGPASVITVFALWCQRDGKPLPKAPKPVAAPAPPAPSRQAPRGTFSGQTPAASSYRGLGGAAGGQAWGQSFQPAMPPAAQPRSAMGTMPSGYGGNPLHSNAGIGGYSPATEQAYFAALEEQQVQAAEEQSRRELQEVLQASRASVEADEEAQLRWALEESARLAEAEKTSVKEQSAEDVQKYYEECKQSKPSSNSSTTAAASAQTALLDSEDEGFAWDSEEEEVQPAANAEEDDEDDDDEGPPPLELIPNSEE